MLKDHLTLMHELRGYASPKARVTRMIKSGEVVQVRRGLFLDPKEAGESLKSLAAVIYGPSSIRRSGGDRPDICPAMPN